MDNRTITWVTINTTDTTTINTDTFNSFYFDFALASLLGSGADMVTNMNTNNVTTTLPNNTITSTT
jgi:hypothetical protein